VERGSGDRPCAARDDTHTPLTLGCRIESPDGPARRGSVAASTWLAMERLSPPWRSFLPSRGMRRQATMRTRCFLLPLWGSGETPMLLLLLPLPLPVRPPARLRHRRHAEDRRWGHIAHEYPTSNAAQMAARERRRQSGKGNSVDNESHPPTSTHTIAEGRRRMVDDRRRPLWMMNAPSSLLLPLLSYAPLIPPLRPLLHGRRAQRRWSNGPAAALSPPTFPSDVFSPRSRMKP